MKTKFLPLAFFFMAALCCSCSHDDNDPVVLPVTPAATDGFTWKENGGSTVHTAASATMSTQYKTIIVRDAASNTIFEFDLTGTSPATYNIGSGNAFTYTAVSPAFAATSGSIVVTSNAGGKASGNFHAIGNAGGITAMDGTFTNITVVP